MKNVTPTVVDETETAMVPAGPRLDPAWDRARELLADGQRAARELAAEIEYLRDNFRGQGHGGVRRGSSFTNVKLETPQGFVAKLSSELNLHPQQAKRILESAEYQRRIEEVATAEIGSLVEYTSPKGEAKALEVTPEVQQLAKEAVADWGTSFPPKPTRQWAGIAGGGETRGQDRNPINHGKALERAVRCFGHSLERWHDVSPSKRAEIEMDWEDLCEHRIFPETFVAAFLRYYVGK